MLLAVTHLGALEPIIVGSIVERPIHWMARREFYSRRWQAEILRIGGAFPVDRAGPALPAVRRAIHLVREGRVVGVFPEGGRVMRSESVISGGPVKAGVCTISIRSGTPVLPVVVLGCDELSGIVPWLPVRRGRVWMAVGREVWPPARTERRSNRSDRIEMAQRLGEEFVRSYRELVSAAGLEEREGGRA